MWIRKYNNMTLEEYFADFNDYENAEAQERVKQYNKELVEVYPFLILRYESTDEVVKNYDYSCTWLDDMEPGWRRSFGEELLDKIKSDLIKNDYLDKFRILQIKEKFGELRFYTGSIPNGSEIYDIINYYESLSDRICGQCGEPAKWLSKGWIYPLCNECATKRYEKEKDFYKDEPIKFEDLFNEH